MGIGNIIWLIPGLGKPQKTELRSVEPQGEQASEGGEGGSHNLIEIDENPGARGSGVCQLDNRNGAEVERRPPG
jgi:hypothetical protein